MINMNMMQNVTKAVHDRVSPSSSQTISCNCDGPINSIDLNRDNTQVVVTGRTVFKIFSIEEDKFEEKFNLRVGKNINLNYSSVDVAWNHTDDHLLASAATNGAVVIWDLNRHTKAKQEFVFHDHSRTVNRVRFHENDAQLLLSGSQDGTIRIFDLRKKDCVTIFRASSSVRDVQWSQPKFNDFFFASADDNGNIQLWDVRRPDKAEKHFTAHSGPVFSIDWHPEDKNWVATSGRDKTIKVWDVNKGYMLHNIQTIASVARIRWRPQRRYNIASTSLVVDFSVNIWDIRRPYVPFAAFEDHKDVTTGIIWKKDDPHMFYTCSKDHFLYQHVFKDAKRPGDHLIPAGIDMNIFGNISCAISDKPENTGKSGQLGRFSFNKREPGKNEDFLTMTKSKMFVYNTSDQDQKMDWFVDCAKNYILKGKPLDEICEHNARLSEKHQRHQVAQSWRMLKVLFSSSPHSIKLPHQPHNHSAMNTHNDKQHKEKNVDGTTSKISNRDKEDTTGEHITGSSDEESDKKNLSNIARGQIDPPEEWELLFGYGEQDNGTSYNIDGAGQDWTLQYEAFQPRHEIKDHGNPLDNIHNGHDSPTISANESENSGSNNQCTKSNVDEEVLTTLTNKLELPDLGFSNMVAEMMMFYAEQGDVQTPVCMLIALGPKLRPQIDERTEEHWFFCYLDLLARFCLWTISNEIIKLSHLPQISEMNHQSTLIHINCYQCNRPLQRVGWLCDRCKTVINSCVICHQPVRGIFLWCQGCSHGGHTSHVKEWFKENIQCPAGCGHLCEFT